MEETLFRTFLIDIFNENTVVYNTTLQVFNKKYRTGLSVV